MKIPIKRTGSQGRSIFLIFWNVQSMFYLKHKPHFGLSLALNWCTTLKKIAICAPRPVCPPKNFISTDIEHWKCPLVKENQEIKYKLKVFNVIVYSSGSQPLLRRPHTLPEVLSSTSQKVKICLILFLKSQIRFRNFRNSFWIY